MRILKVGKDVAAKWFDVCVIVDEKPVRRRYDNNFNGFAKALSWYRSFGAEKIEIAVEPTGHYGWLLFEFMHRNGCTILQVQPLMFRKYAESLDMRGKSDQKDALALAKHLEERAGSMRRWEPKSDLWHELRDVQILLRSLTKRAATVRNQLQCGLRSEYVQAELKAELASLEERLDTALDRAECIIRQDEQLSRDLEFVDSIPGIARKTAVMLVTLVDFRRFKNARAVACFLGLTKRKHSSGTSIQGQERMSKRGSVHVRSQLFMPARTAVQHDPVCGALYYRLRERGKTDAQAQVAVIRRMVTVAWALVNRQVSFDRNHVNQFQTTPI
jgi:transposase